MRFSYFSESQKEPINYLVHPAIRENSSAGQVHIWFYELSCLTVTFVRFVQRCSAQSVGWSYRDLRSCGAAFAWSIEKSRRQPRFTFGKASMVHSRLCFQTRTPLLIKGQIFGWTVCSFRSCQASLPGLRRNDKRAFIIVADQIIAYRYSRMIYKKIRDFGVGYMTVVADADNEILLHFWNRVGPCAQFVYFIRSNNGIQVLSWYFVSGIFRVHSPWLLLHNRFCLEIYMRTSMIV